MKLSTTILGSSAVKHLEASYDEHILIIGRDRFTRRQLATVSCFNYHAARNLTTLLQEFGVRDARDLFDRVPPSALALPRMGVISMAVLGAAFEVRKLGGDDPLGNWARAHAGDAKRAMVTFYTMKHRAELLERAAKKDERRRRAHTERHQASA